MAFKADRAGIHSNYVHIVKAIRDMRVHVLEQFGVQS
jgi:hypothetical protein